MDWQAALDWISDPKIQNTLTWLGGGLVVIASGVWAVVRLLGRSKTVVKVKADRGSSAAGRDLYSSGGEPKNPRN